MICKPLITRPSVSPNYRAGFYLSTDKPNKTLTADIGYPVQANSSKPFRFKYFYRNHYDRLLFNCAPRETFFLATNIRFINFNLTTQQVASRGDHGASHFMQPTPSGLITAKPEYSFQAKGIPAIFLVGYMPDGKKPCPQRLTGFVKDGTSCDRGLSLTMCTADLSARSQPSSASATRRANKACWPAQPHQVTDAGILIGKPLVKLNDRSWVINSSYRMSRKNRGVHATSYNYES